MLLFFILIMFFGGVLMRRFGNNDACPDDIDSSFRVSDRVQVIAAVVVLVLAFAAAVVFAGFAGHEKYEDYVVDRTWENVREIAGSAGLERDGAGEYIGGRTMESDNNSENGSAGGDDGAFQYELHPESRMINWDELYAINTDISFWVYIPGTQVDYPVMQEQEFGKAFYLDHNIYKKSQKSGSIFTPKGVPGSTYDMHMLLYGHHMKSGSMFGSITKYKDAGYAADHAYLYLYYPDRTEKWGIWTAEHVVDDDIVYLMPYMDGSYEYENLLRYLEKNSVFKTDYFGVDNYSRTLTLSTCDSTTDADKGRFVVNAVFLESMEPGTVMDDGGVNVDVNHSIFDSDVADSYDGY